MTASKDRDTGLWRYHFQLAGKRYTKRGFATKRLATKAEEKRREELVREISGHWPTFSQMVDDYLRELAHQASDEWLRQVHWKLDRHAGPLMRLVPSEIRPVHVQRILSGVRESVSPRTSNEIRKILHAVFKWADDLGAIDRNPVRSVRRSAVESKEQPVITTEHLRRVLLASSATLRALLLVQATTGARCREIIRLRPQDVDLEAGSIVLRTRKTGGQGERARRAHLTPRALAAMAAQVELASDEWVFRGRWSHRPVTYIAMLRQLWRACERAKVPRYGFHAVRRWAGTTAMEAGNSNVIVSRFLGHTKTTVTDLYMRVGDPLMAAVGEVLENEIVGTDGGTPEKPHRHPHRGKL